MEDENRLTKKVVCSVAQACISPFLSGAAVSSGDIFYNAITAKYGSKQAGVIYELMNVLLFVGAFTSNIIAECVTLKTTNLILASDALFTFGFLVFFFNCAGTYYAGRFSIGMAYGIVGRIVPVYLSRVGPIEHRGNIAGMFGVFSVLGLIFGTFLNTINGPYAYALVLLAILPAIHAAIVTHLLEIPYRSPPPTDRSITFLTMVCNREAYRSIFLITVYTTAHNFTCVNHIIFNSSVIFGTRHQYQWLIMAYTFSLVVTFFTAHLMDKVGRKPLSIASGTLIAGVALTFYFKWHSIFFVFVFMLGFSLGLNNFPFILVGEIFPPDYVPHGAILMTSINWLTALASIIMLGSANPDYNNFPYIINSSLMGAFVVIVILFFRETKDQPPEFQ